MARTRIRPCCGTLTDRTRPSPHARDCPAYPADDCRTGGPFCIARACPIVPLHRAESAGCILSHPQYCRVYARRTPALPWHNGMMTYRWTAPDGTITVDARPCLGCGATESAR
jgi:hypothetical protein